MNSGIYKITNLVNNKIYIGSAVNFYRRWKVHKSYLKNNKHPSKHLQASYNMYGTETFNYSVLIYCEIKDLLFFEQR